MSGFPLDVGFSSSSSIPNRPRWPMQGKPVSMPLSDRSLVSTAGPDHLCDMVKSTGVLSRRDDSDANERRLYPVHGEFIKSRGNRRLVEWSKLDLLESNHVCGLNGLSRKKDAKPEVTRRYTVHI